MQKRKFMAFINLILISVLIALILSTSPVLTQESPGQMKFKNKITPEERTAAADLFQQQFQAALTEGTIAITASLTPADADPGGTPHYFGPYPNWANSPLPKGVIASVEVTNGGSGYTTANVEITDLYYGIVADPATATATIVGGVITGIILTYAGSGYSAPVVTITGAGTGAMAIATIGPPFTGGIRKFIDSLPSLRPTGANNLGQYIPVAVADTESYPGSDYYEIALVEYVEQMHTQLPPTRHRGYVQLETAVVSGAQVQLFYPDGVTPIYYPGTTDPVFAMDNPHFMGPAIVSQRDVPVRIKFYNLLPTGEGGDLFIPVDTTVMGSGMGPNMAMPMMAEPVDGATVEITTSMPHNFQVGTKVMLMGFTPDDYNGTFRVISVPDNTHFQVTLAADPGGPATTLGEVVEMHTENRATVHLHGSNTVWISDGTPHQWITPAGEATDYPQGVSVVPVPDMGDVDPGLPDDGVMTFYYTNQHSARLMFYHDHSYGITRLNVYAGEAAAYLVTDQVEKDMIEGTNVSGVNPSLLKVLPTVVPDVTDYGIPLVIQDRTFVDADSIGWQDPTWNWGTGARDPVTGKITEYITGDLWYPHVYIPAQNPYNPDGANPFGRWHYAAWFWPPATNLAHPPVPNPYYGTAPWEPLENPGVPDNSSPGEAFMDTPIVNGTVYPYLEVEPTAVRFRILNAADDRFFNLQWYVADETGYISDTGFPTEVSMVPAGPTPGWPELWPTDGREGGAPDPATRGPDWIQIGNEGGFLPKPVIVPNQPTTWVTDPTLFNAGNVKDHSLLLGTAERADVIVDFSQFAGKTLILYNDAPAAFPALDPHYDYYTNCPDRTDIGGAPTTQPGYGPNTRTIMQVRVAGTPTLKVSSINVVSGGSAYSEPVVNIVGGGSPTTVATATASGSVERVSLWDLGSGMTAPTVTIDPPPAGGTQATATATVVGGYVTSITVTNPGSGYTSAPKVIFSDPNNKAKLPKANAALKITGVTVTKPGVGYSSAPKVVIRETKSTGVGIGARTAAIMFNTAPPYDLAELEAVFAKTATKPGVFETVHDDIIVPSADYNSAYNADFPADPFIRQDQNSHTFTSVGGTEYTIPIEPKALQDEMGEVFDEYGRMMVMEGLELPFTAAGVQNFIMYGYASPPVEVIKGVYASQIGTTEDGTQIWKITHNGVDTHTIHVHLFNAQLINRVAWDGFVYPPDPNELGWKETFRVNPLEHTIIALRAVVPEGLPFDLPNSNRLIDITMPDGEILKDTTGADAAGLPPLAWAPNGDPIDIYNHYVNFGWEYVYHCHILAHEEMDMMHAVVVAVPPLAPSDLQVDLVTTSLSWVDNSLSETGFTIQKSVDGSTWVDIDTVSADTTAFIDPTMVSGDSYRVFAFNTVGDTWDYSDPNLNELVPGVPAFPTMTVYSGFSNTVTVP
jgi:FtsP/CotA-like multicopper oxidase with cupredoxin domain